MTSGLVLLLAGGIWQLSNARLSGPGVKRSQLVSPDAAVLTPRDRKTPSRVLSDVDKLRSVLVAALEVGLIAVSVWTAMYVAAQPGVVPAFKALVVATMAVGATLVARGVYVRLGLFRPELDGLADYRQSLAVSMSAGVAEEFADIHRSLSTARSEENIDATTVGVLAAARQGRPLDEVLRWGEGADVAEAEAFEERADALAEAGLIRTDDADLQLAPDFEDADPDQIATVAATVLN